MIAIFGIVLSCAIPEIDRGSEDPDDIFLKALLIQHRERQADCVGPFIFPFHFPADPWAFDAFAFGPLFRGLIVNAEIVSD